MNKNFLSADRGVNLECQPFRQQRMQNSNSISSKNVNRLNVFTQAGLTTYKYTEFLKNLYRLKFSSSLWSSMNFLNILWKTSQPYIISYICRFSNLRTPFNSPENILLYVILWKKISLFFFLSQSQALKSGNSKVVFSHMIEFFFFF